MSTAPTAARTSSDKSTAQPTASSASLFALEKGQSSGVNDECSRCRDLLEQVWLRPDSRPRRLLASLFDPAARTVEWRSTSQGIQVRIPTEDSQPAVPLHRRRWTRLTRLYAQQEEEAEVAAASSVALNPPASWMSATSALRTAGASSDVKALETVNENQSTHPSSEALVRAKSSVENSVPNSAETMPRTEWMQVSCRPCSRTGPEAGARAYVMGPQPLSMVICSNRLPHKTTEEMEEIVTHELVHVYDVRQSQLDLRDCENLAYSEVRAAREAECRKHLHNNHRASSFAPQSWWSSPSYQAAALAQCVRQKAYTATRNLFPIESRQCLGRVFDKAMADTRPFENAATSRRNVKHTGPAGSAPSRAGASLDDATFTTSSR